MSKCEIKIEKAGASAKIKITGVVDEDTDFKPYALTGLTQADFHLGGIKGINSCGIREWIKWLETGTGTQISYHECPKIFVDQINMVQGFLPANGLVASFYVPYFHEESGNEKAVLFTKGKEYAENGTVTPPAAVKDDQGHPMEMDVVEAKYFKFLKK